MELIFYVVPAALFYAWVIGLGWLAVRPGQPISSRLAWGILAAVPVAWYLSGFVTGQLDYTRQRAQIAKLAGVARPKDTPRTMVVWGKREPWQDELVELGALDAIYVSDHKTGYRERGPWKRIAYLRSPRCLNSHTKGMDAIALRRAQTAFIACAVADEVPSAPTEGLTFNIGERWHLSLREKWESSLTPYELFWTRPGQEDELIGYWEQAQGSWPMVPPAKAEKKRTLASPWPLLVKPLKTKRTEPMNPSVSMLAGRSPACTSESTKSSKWTLDLARISPPVPWATSVPALEIEPAWEMGAELVRSTPSR